MVDTPVLVVGDVMVDVVIAHRGPVVPDSDTPSRIRSSGGGSAANTASWLGALGIPTRLLAAVGDDSWSEWVRADLAAVGVELIGPTVVGEVTGTCAVLVAPDGERTMFPDRGANDRLSPNDVGAAFRPVPGWVHLSGYALLGAGSRDAALAALAAAGDAGVPVSVDAASSGPLLAVGAERFLDWIAGTAVVLANDLELAALGGEAAVLEKVGAVVTKHGRDGAEWTDGSRHASTAGVPVEPVDSTGAGDAFAAGWIAAVRAGADEQSALERAAALGARAVSRPGARPAVGS